MKKIILAIALFVVTSAQGALVELDTTQEFKNLIAGAQVPVLVQFSAAWCGPCKALKAVMLKVAPSYTDDQVILAYVDADINSSLKSYLMGGYPTVRTFLNGTTTSASFVGSKSESFVRSFVDDLIADRGEANFCSL